MLKYITPKRWWGGNGDIPVGSLGDRLFVSVIGVRVAVFDENSHGTNNMSPTTSNSILFPEYELPIAQVLELAVSEDKKYLATAVVFKGNDSLPANGAPKRNKLRNSEATMLVYEANTYLFPDKKPVLLKHTIKAGGAQSNIVFSSITFFSSDSSILACRVHETILVYDWRLEEVRYTIERVPSSVKVLSFYPKDVSKLCAVGAGNLFKVWRFSRNTVHDVPVSGSASLPCTYTTITWLGKDLVLTGTNTGVICFFSMLSCEFRHRLQIFEPHETIVNVLLRAGNLACLSESGQIVILDLTTDDPLNIQCEVLGRYSLPSSAVYRGMQWFLHSNLLAYDVVISSSVAIKTYDLKVTQLQQEGVYRAIGETDPYVIAGAEGSVTTGNSSTLVTKNNRRSGGNQSVRPNSNLTGRPINDLSKPQSLTSRHQCILHHAAAVTSLCVARRMDSILSASEAEGCLRVWNYAAPKGTCLVEHRYAEGLKSDVPSHVAMHPSGRTVAFACSDDVQEYAVAYRKLIFIRRIPVRVAVEINGDPYANYSPAAFVAYSHRGHFLAAITGKSIQVFDLNNFEYSADLKGNVSTIAI